MALITCPECGGKVSDQAAVCIHCGYPLKVAEITSNQISFSKKVVIPTYQGADPTKIPAIKLVMSINQLSLSEAKDFVEQKVPYVVLKDGLSENLASEIVSQFYEIGVDAKMLDSSEQIHFASAESDRSTICCPKCGSTEYHAGQRGYSLLTGFIGSGKTVLTCLKCGNRWKPGK